MIPRSINGKRTPTFNTYRGMISRCTRSKDKRYERYGGRGITVDARWESYDAFYADMGERPDGHTLDRIDNDGPYSPENCSWETVTTQNRKLGKLDMDKAREIRRSKHVHVETLASRYGVSISAIKRVQLGQSWAENVSRET